MHDQRLVGPHLNKAKVAGYLGKGLLGAKSELLVIEKAKQVFLTRTVWFFTNFVVCVLIILL